MFTALAFFSTMLMQTPDLEPALTLYTEHNPPFTYYVDEKNTVGGATMTVVQELMQRAEISYSVELVPWKRAYAQTLREKNACVFGMNRTPEREGKFLWVSPLFEGPWSFFKRPGKEMDLTSIDDLTPYRVVATNGYASANALKQTGHRNVLLAPNNERAMQLLYHGRVDLMLMGDFEVPYVAREVSLPVPEKVLHFREAYTALGCNLKSDPTLISKLQAVNATMAAFREKTYNSLGD